MRLPISILACLLAVSSLLAPLAAQETQAPPTTQDPVPTVQDIEGKIDTAQDAESLTEEQKTEVLAALNEALDLVRRGDAAKSEAERFAAETAAAPAELARVQQALAQPAGGTEPDPDPGATLQDLDQLATAAQAAGDAAAEQLASLTQEIRDRPVRRTALPQLIADAEAEQNALPEQPVLDPEAAVQVTDGQRTLFFARRYEVTWRLASLRNELARDQAGGELLTARRDLAARRATETSELAGAWQALVQEQREAAAQRAEQRAAEAVEQTEGDHPFLAELAAENRDLAEKRRGLTAGLDRARQEKQQAEDSFRQLDEDLASMESQIEIAGLTDAIGTLLRERLADLPDIRTYDRRNAARGTEISDVLLDLNHAQDQRQQLVDDAGHLDRRLASLDPPVSDPQELERIRLRGEELLGTRLRDLNAINDLGEQYLPLLVVLDTTEKQVLVRADEYARFITEKVLWIRSTTPVWRPAFEPLTEAVRWFLLPAHWAEAGRVLAAGASSGSPAIPIALVLLLAIFLRGRVWRRIRALGVKAESLSTVSFGPTFKTLLWTIVVAAPAPLLILLCGRQLIARPDQEFTVALGWGLHDAARVVFFYSFLRNLMLPGGLAAAHFQWRSRTLALVLGNLRWLFPIALVGTFVLATLSAHGEADWNASLGRSVLLVVMLADTVFLWRLLNPRTGIGADSAARDRGWFDRFHKFWLALGVGIPAGLFLLAFLGYQFTAQELFQRLRTTFSFMAVAILLNSLILRALALGGRRLALLHAKEQMRDAAEGQEGAEAPPPKEEKLDLSSVNRQTQEFLRAGLALFVLLGSWGIWADVLPALSVLEQVTLWEETGVDGAPLQTITLASLCLAVLWVAMTVLAARNIPGVMEMTVLQRLKVRAGNRNAITTLTRYAIFLIGMILAFSTIGIGWDKVQWLAAAVSVGLGFGLQEIFANFVSGLIILFERPVRIGDLVTVGTTTVGTTDGFVTRIQMRATTVTDFNRRELVIPNKQFITGSIINWSLSDPMIRVVVKVGVAFGSDVEKAKSLLLKIADENPLILKKPEPMAVFVNFGEHTLDLELRAFLPSRDERPQASDELHTRIDKEFRAAGIEIALPKRDILVRTEPAQDWVRRGAETAPAAPVEG